MSRFRIVDDDCGHNFIIPADKLVDWEIWMESEDCENGITPEYAERLDSPTFLTFENYEVE